VWYSDGGNCRALEKAADNMVEAQVANTSRRTASRRTSIDTRGTGLELTEGKMGVEFMFPRCRKCGAGDLVPLSDFGSQGASIQFKAWVCTNPNCLYNVKIRNGDIIINEPVSDGSMHSYRGSR
jgi:hypothetical protein